MQNGHAGTNGHTNGAGEAEDDAIPMKTHAVLALRHLQREAKALRKALKQNAKAQAELAALILALGAHRIDD